MSETKVLKDDELKQVTGGAEIPEGATPKYSEGEIVVNKLGWTLKIVKVIGWCTPLNCAIYETIIIGLPSDYDGLYKINETYNTDESMI